MLIDRSKQVFTNPDSYVLSSTLGNVEHLTEQKSPLVSVRSITLTQVSLDRWKHNNTSHQQACRGDKHDDPVIAQDSIDGTDRPAVNETEVDAAGVYTLPAGADFIMCYSVAQGKF